MLLAMRRLQRSLGIQAAEWATNQLSEGRDTRHLRQLAGTTGAENRFELEELFDRAVNELGIVVPEGDEALALYARELAQQYLDGTVSRDYLLRFLSDLCVETDYSKELYPFYLLRWTLEDLEYQGSSFYIAHATRDNFDGLLRTEIDRLLANEHTKA
jgi:hypothetical protein